MSVERYPFVASAQLMAGAALAFLIWEALPARYLPVDIVGSGLAALLVLGGASLLIGRAWGKKVAIAAAGASFVLGTLGIALLAFGAGELSGLYGPVGKGGAIIFVLVIALAFAYFVALPGLELAALLGDARPRAETEREREAAGPEA